MDQNELLILPEDRNDQKCSDKKWKKDILVVPEIVEKELGKIDVLFFQLYFPQQESFSDTCNS